MQRQRDAADDSRHSGFNRADVAALTTKVGVNDGRAAAHWLHHGHGGAYDNEYYTSDKISLIHGKYPKSKWSGR